MTRKDYKLIASVLNHYQYDYAETKHTGILVDLFSKELEKENPRFDRQKFEDAVYKEK